MKRFLSLIVVLAAVQAIPAGQAKGDNPKRLYQLHSLGKTKLKVGVKTIESWVMDTDAKRQEGMMFVNDKDTKISQGMIFVFGQSQGSEHGFWMHNTLIPLDIIYIGASKKVVGIQHGKALDDTNLPGGGDYNYVLELKKGGAAKYGIKKGSKIGIPASIKSLD